MSIPASRPQVMDFFGVPNAPGPAPGRLPWSRAPTLARHLCGGYA